MSQRRQDLFQFVRTRRLRGDVAKRVQRYYAAVDWRGLSEEDKDVINGRCVLARVCGKGRGWLLVSCAAL